MANLKVTTVQTYLFWENIDKNLDYIAKKLTSIREKTDLIVLPEMFSTGFTINVNTLAENMNGKTMKWMEMCANLYSSVITGSIIIQENNEIFNRLIWMYPNGNYVTYDKHHLFRLGNEHKNFSAGKKKLIVDLNGWKILPIICYDLRFPVWLRNTKKSPYDLLLVVANWPEKRSLHWKTLIQARAIENQIYSIGVNRVGYDGNQIYHSGDSMVIDPTGNLVYYKRDEEDIYTFTIYEEELLKARRSHPFLQDADSFSLK